MYRTHEEVAQSRIALLFIKMAVIYLLLGLALGLGMALSGQYQLRPVHTHINLLGWVTLAVTGIIYQLYSPLGTTRLARWHLWTYNLGLPVMMVSLGGYHLGYQAFAPLLGLGSLMTAAGVALFAYNLFRQLAVGKTVRRTPVETP